MPRIAFVNDERSLLGPFRMRFEAEGFAIETFHDPLEALPHLITQPPDVLILNGPMPNMHGIEFFRRFRRYSRVPVIMYSTSADEIAKQLQAEGCPADAYTHPITPSQMLPMVRQALIARRRT